MHRQIGGIDLVQKGKSQHSHGLFLSSFFCLFDASCCMATVEPWSVLWFSPSSFLHGGAGLPLYTSLQT
uniref:Uncharacterized protein n=1 Tax=Arundo donax TaxID=35708 RepID=A0A0A9SEE5_ARUDO